MGEAVERERDNSKIGRRTWLHMSACHCALFLLLLLLLVLGVDGVVVLLLSAL